MNDIQKKNKLFQINRRLDTIKRIQDVEGHNLFKDELINLNTERQYIEWEVYDNE